MRDQHNRNGVSTGLSDMVFQRKMAAVTTADIRHGEGQKGRVSTKIKYLKKDNKKLTSLPVDPRKLYCNVTPIMFARSVCSLLSFFARKFPEKSEN